MKKRRVKGDCPENTLVEKCNKLTKRDCSSPIWKDHEDLDEEKPAENVVALVVDTDRSAGSVWFSAASTGLYIDMVGQDYKGLVIVRLEPDIKYMCIGECRVGTVLQQESTT
ncbi:hypothetical protein HYQ46_000958 [Verticillium longisporum]|nr:hypothetical protein HYQ44_017051 [Verticillium longisporum]KAG7150108.1 hypothetical protein HYQ46_000958 [Verticillium longisporum]